MPTFDSPYETDGEWHRGNLHTHSTESDGTRDVDRVLADYQAQGYDFLAVSDHDVIVDVDEYRDQTKMTLLPAVEVGGGPHVLHIGARSPIREPGDRQAVLEAITADDGLAVLAHPNWSWEFNHWSDQQLDELTNYHGIEIFNGLAEESIGGADATDRWDRLLSEGKRVWGFANDDSHWSWNSGKAWNEVQATAATPEAILASLKQGRFYASTGVKITDIVATDNKLSVETANATHIKFISEYGSVQRAVNGHRATFRIPDDLVHPSHLSDELEYSYVRVECYGTHDEMAWTQPIEIT